MRSSLPLISVIVPVYNAAGYLNACLRSIAAQTYTNLEILLIDDGSSDGSAALCDAMAETDARFRVIHKPHAGVAAARNAGVAAVRGDFFGFVDSDDMIRPGMFARLYELISESGADLAACQCISEPYTEESADAVAAGTGGRSSRILGRREAVLLFLKGESRVRSVLWNKLYPRSFLKVMTFPEGVVYEDNEVTLKALLEARTVAVTDEILYLKRDRRASIINTRSASNARDFVRSAETVASLAREAFPSDKEIKQTADERVLWTKLVNWKRLQLFSDEESRALAGQFRASALQSPHEIIRQVIRHPRLTKTLFMFVFAPRLYRVLYRMRAKRRGEDVK